MATARSQSQLGEFVGQLDQHAQAVWDHFTPEERGRMAAEDIEAGKRVSMILISVIAAGTVMGIITLVVVLATS